MNAATQHTPKLTRNSSLRTQIMHQTARIAELEAALQAAWGELRELADMRLISENNAALEIARAALKGAA